MNFQDMVADFAYCIVHCEDENTKNEELDEEESIDIEPELIALMSKILGGVDMGYKQYRW